MPLVTGAYLPNVNNRICFGFAYWHSKHDPSNLLPDMDQTDINGSGLVVPLLGDMALKSHPDLGHNWSEGEPDAPYVTYEFDWPHSGNMRVGFRATAPDGAGNSVWFQLNGSPWVQTGIRTTIGDWNSATFEGTSPGLYVLKMQLREDGPVFDRVVVSVGAIPGGTGALNAEPLSPRSSGSVTRRRVSKWR